MTFHLLGERVARGSCSVASKGVVSLSILLSIAAVILYVCLSLANGPGNEGVQRGKDEVQEELALKPNIVIRNNVIGDSGFGVYIGPREDTITVIDNIIIDNGEGIRLMGTKGKHFISGNTITDNIIGVRVTDYYQGITFLDMAVSLITIRSNTIAGNEDHNLLNLTSGVLDMADNRWEQTHEEQENGEDEASTACVHSYVPLAVAIPLFTPIAGTSPGIRILGMGMINSPVTLALNLVVTFATPIAAIGDRELARVTNPFSMSISLSGLSFSSLAAPEVDKGN